MRYTIKNKIIKKYKEIVIYYLQDEMNCAILKPSKTENIDLGWFSPFEMCGASSLASHDTMPEGFVVVSLGLFSVLAQAQYK